MAASAHADLARDFATAVTCLRLVGELSAADCADAETLFKRALLDQPAAIIVDAVHLGDRADITSLDRILFSAASVGLPVSYARMSAGPASRLDSGVPVFPTTAAAATAALTVPAARPRRHAYFPPATNTLARVRLMLRDTCGGWRLNRIRDEATIVAVELVGNAVRHAGTELDLTVSLIDRQLWIGVRDRDRRIPHPVVPPVVDNHLAEGGRGLPIVKALASRWGAAAADDGKTVWASIAA